MRCWHNYRGCSDLEFYYEETGMRTLKHSGVLVLVVFLAAGCGKSSKLEGKVVDDKGQPIPHVKIVATQVQPLKGYEHFEATTGTDGQFRFGKLFPSSEYVLSPWSDAWANIPMMTVQYDPTKLLTQFHKDGWATDRQMTVQSGPEGQTLILPAPLKVMPAITILEGKVLDGKEHPIANLKVLARQVQPEKNGYERFETNTGEDGGFRFDRLFPGSRYTLTPQFDNWSGGMSITVQTGPEQQTVSLPSPLIIRFMLSQEGLVMDSRTGLMWVAAPERDVNWEQASNYVRGLRVGGYSDWRLPTRLELKSLWKPSAGLTVHPAYRVAGKGVWSSEMEGSSMAWDFWYSENGREFASNRSNTSNNRVLAVRPAK
jgi:hypothetical protein